MDVSLVCPYCGKECRTQGGLKQHISKTEACSQKQRLEVTSRVGTAEHYKKDAHHGQNRDQKKAGTRKSTRVASRLESLPNPDAGDDESDTAFHTNPDDMSTNQEPDESDEQASGSELEADDENDDNSTEYSSLIGNESATDDEDGDADETSKMPAPDTEMLKQFKEFCDSHADQFMPFRKEDKAAIRLLHTLKRKRAPLNAYKEVLEWHLKETNHLQPDESLKDSDKYFLRNTIMKQLLKRYNMEAMLPKLKQLTLPHSKAVVSIPYRDAKDCIVSLLTDPRVEDHHYLFFNQDPFAPPPEKVTYLEDLNTGDAYLESYKKLVTEPNEVLLPISFYIDGAVTGQFSDLPVTALKMALGIHNRVARDNEWAWREVAWIPQVRKHQARGKKLFTESKHMESYDVDLLDREGEYAESDSDDNESVSSDEEEEAVKAQDFHTMLSFALSSFVKLQETGFKWNKAAYGKIFPGIKFIPIVINVKCDTEEGDLNCGKYTVRTRNVKHVCRYCHCPTEEADDPNARYKLKTQTEIEKLVTNRNMERLKQISQQYIKNAWYKVRFHVANDRGIHGACPSEMLHAILLGIFKYCRNIFFLHMGEESKLAEDINGLAQMYGKLLTHQSDRDLPYTNFAKGIQRGKLMAKQFRGVLLVMAATIRSSLGRSLLRKKKRFGGEDGLRDWTLLVELLLEWEAFLCQKRMKRSHVQRLAKKHRFIMYIMRNVARRSKGMGLKIMKFHAIIHLVEEILLYGVPSEFDTGSNESHHKTTKVAAKLTQRKEVTFDLQTAKRMTEFMAIELAMLEIELGKPVAEYFQRGMESASSESDSDARSQFSDGLATEMGRLDVSRDDSDSDESGTDVVESRLAGTKLEVCTDSEDEGRQTFKVKGKSKFRDKRVWAPDVIEFLSDLQELVLPYIRNESLSIRTELERGKILFRGHPNYRGTGPWRDWAIVDWGQGWGRLPSHIWCFVELRGMPKGNQRLEFGGVTLENEAYAVVEVAEYDQIPNQDLKSDLFIPITKEVSQMDAEGKEVTKRKFYLAPVTAFVEPCIVIPDIGGNPNAYFYTKARRDWAKEFIIWLKDRHEDDVMIFTEDETVEVQPKKRAKRSQNVTAR